MNDRSAGGTDLPCRQCRKREATVRIATGFPPTLCRPCVEGMIGEGALKDDGLRTDGGRSVDGSDWPVGSGAVLYKRDTWHGDEPEMWHVEDVYHPETGGDAYVHIWDGTHTTDEWLHIEDLRAVYDPAGWSCSEKPTYILTRRHGHRAYPQDGMAPEVYQ